MCGVASLEDCDECQARLFDRLSRAIGGRLSLGRGDGGGERIVVKDARDQREKSCSAQW